MEARLRSLILHVHVLISLMFLLYARRRQGVLYDQPAGASLFFIRSIAWSPLIGMTRNVIGAGGERRRPT